MIQFICVGEELLLLAALSAPALFGKRAQPLDKHSILLECFFHVAICLFEPLVEALTSVLYHDAFPSESHNIMTRILSAQRTNS